MVGIAFPFPFVCKIVKHFIGITFTSLQRNILANPVGRSPGHFLQAHSRILRLNTLLGLVGKTLEHFVGIAFTFSVAEPSRQFCRQKSRALYWNHVHLLCGGTFSPILPAKVLDILW
jgi:hypothetical protein